MDEVFKEAVESSVASLKTLGVPKVHLAISLLEIGESSFYRWLSGEWPTKRRNAIYRRAIRTAAVLKQMETTVERRRPGELRKDYIARMLTTAANLLHNAQS